MHAYASQAKIKLYQHVYIIYAVYSKPICSDLRQVVVRLYISFGVDASPATPRH
jgi:hypothetical protein